MARLRDWFIVLAAQFFSLARRACHVLAVVGRIRRNGNLVAGVLEDGAGGVAGIGAFKGDL